MHQKFFLESEEEHTGSPFHKEGMISSDECIFKKCCKKYKRKGKHCRRCPKLS